MIFLGITGNLHATNIPKNWRIQKRFRVYQTQVVFAICFSCSFWFNREDLYFCKMEHKFATGEAPF